MDSTVRNIALTIMLSVPMAACARCAPNTVSTGVSRLTMRNLAALVEILNDEATPCGFESEQAKAGLQLTAALGRLGTGTWRIENCLIEIPESDPYVSTDCNGNQTLAWGTVNVTAERRITGVLGGEEDNPVVPGGPDDVVIDIERADFSQFVVRVSNSDNALTWRQGSISGVLAPRLAVDDDLGACSFVTSHATLSGVRYGPDTKVYVETEDMDFNVNVNGSELYAVNGQVSGRENELWGWMGVWGSRYDVPNDEDGLDPDYNPDLFDATFDCKEGLSQPLSFACEDFLDPILAQNGARITMRLLGRIASVLEDDEKCGFSSTAVLESGVLEGVVGGQGAATFEVRGCALSFPETTVVSRSCTGSPSEVTGRVVVDATKRIEGRLTGDLQTPVVPMTDRPAYFDVRVTAFEDFEVSESGTAIVAHHGGLSGRVTPRVAANTADSGACSSVSDIVRFADVAWEPSEVTIRADEGTFRTTIQQSNLRALNGAWEGDTNMLRGSIVLNDTPFQLPTDPDDDGLDPDYDPAAFDAGWQCGDVELPARFDCAFDKPLAEGAAQLGVQTFGMMATLIEGDENCGFSSPQVLDAVVVEGRVGFPDARATFTLSEPCELSYDQPTIIDTDCNGINTYAQGTARVTGTMVQVGFASGDRLEPIVPTSREPAALSLTGTFDDFAIWTDPGENILTVKSGRMSGVVAPRVAIDTSLGACSIITPVAKFRELRYSQAEIALEQDGRRFDMRIDRSRLEAVNGNTETATNQLTGEIVMDGTRYPLPIDDGEPILNPDYDQPTFDASYACYENLRVPATDTDCNMKQAIGEGLARLLMLSVGTLAAEVYGNDDCGFEDFFVQIDPDVVEGDDGEPGRLSWRVNDCEINGTLAEPNSTDCLGGQRFMAGRYLLDARLTVTGRRDTDFIIFDSIIPDDPNSVSIDVIEGRLQNFQIYDVRPNETEPYRLFGIDDGVVAGLVEPILGENAQSRGTYDIATPVVRLTAVQLIGGARVTVFTENKTFKVYADSAQLEGFNGSYAGLPGLTNTLRGHVIVDGTVVEIDLPLDPEFEQESFDESYACTTDLVATVPPE